MESRSVTEPAQTRRAWVVLLYFYLAALVGLGFVIAGVTTVLFGIKDIAFPRLGVNTYSYESSLHHDAQGNITSSDAERAAAEQRVIDDRRREGADNLLDGVILAAVGAPVLVWHLRRGRRAGEPSTPPPSEPA